MYHSHSQAEYDKLRLLHEASIEDSQNDLHDKLNALTEELDAKWKNILR